MEIKLLLSFTEVHIFPMLIAGVFMLISMYIGNRLRSKFKKYSETPLVSGMTGREVAQKMLDDHGLNDVKVICVDGELTDHYNPMKKTVNLSRAVHDEANAAATAVAAHECGHAVQHATAYSMLKFRSAMVPITNIVSSVMPMLMMGVAIGSSFLYSSYPLTEVLYIIIAMNAVVALFALITLPVEFDASKRALAWIQKEGVVTSSEYAMSKDALKWAAMTYVVAALAAVAQLLYWVMMLLGSDD